MTKTTVLETDYATLWYYPETKVVHHVVHKYIYGAQLRAVLLKGLECLQQHDAKKWLSDDRKSSALPQADIDWSTEHWIPEMLEVGWQYWAIVLPDGAVGRQNLGRVMESYAKLGITVAAFGDPDEALHWLESM